MRVDYRVILALCVPLAAALVLLFSAGGQLHHVDGPSEYALGFPFIWIVDGPNSLSWIVSLPALALNYLLYLLVLSLLFARFGRWGKLARIAAPIVWVIAVGVALVHWRIITIDPTYVWWIDREAGSWIGSYGLRFFGLVFHN